MSHIVKIQTEVRDSAAVRAACQRRRLPVPVDGIHKLFSGEATGLAVQLPDWRPLLLYSAVALRYMPRIFQA